MLIYKLDPAAGALTLHSQAAVTVGGSARHLTVHPNGRWVYVNEEKGGRVNLFDWDDEAGTLSLRQQVSTLPADWTSGGTCANVQPIQTCWHMSLLRNDLI